MSPCLKRPKVLISVKSAVMDFEFRQIIRNTYKSVALSLNMQILFFIGSNVNVSLYNNLVKLEAEFYDDIVQADYSDTYRNLTLKTYSMLTYQVFYCKNVEYFFNADSDVMIFPEHLLEFLSAHKEIFNNSIIGNCRLNGSVVIRIKGNKWYMPIDIYPDEFYPPYCLGCGYISTKDVPKKLLDVLNSDLDSLWWKRISVDDVLFTGILAKIANISIINNNLVAYFREKTNSLDICQTHVISIHRFRISQMKKRWNLYREQLENCSLFLKS